MVVESTVLHTSRQSGRVSSKGLEILMQEASSKLFLEGKPQKYLEILGLINE